MSGTADGVLYKRDLYTYRVFCRPGVRGTTNKNAPHFCEAFGAENETRTRDPDLGNREKWPWSALYGRFLNMGRTKNRDLLHHLFYQI